MKKTWKWLISKKCQNFIKMKEHTKFIAVRTSTKVQVLVLPVTTYTEGNLDNLSVQ